MQVAAVRALQVVVQVEVTAMVEADVMAKEVAESWAALATAVEAVVLAEAAGAAEEAIPGRMTHRLQSLAGCSSPPLQTCSRSQSPDSRTTTPLARSHPRRSYALLDPRNRESLTRIPGSP